MTEHLPPKIQEVQRLVQGAAMAVGDLTSELFNSDEGTPMVAVIAILPGDHCCVGLTNDPTHFIQALTELVETLEDAVKRFPNGTPVDDTKPN